MKYYKTLIIFHKNKKGDDGAVRYLTNLTTSPKIMNWFDNDWGKVRKFLNKHQLDSVELMLREEPNINDIPRDCVKGLHLNYWPIWLDFWRGNTIALQEQFGSTENIELFYGSIDKNILIQHYRREWEVAQELEVEYVVFHVAHVELIHTYTKEFTYNDWDVMEAAIELVNQSFGNKDVGIKLLFENLWWPGLKLTDRSLSKKFLDRIQYPNKGFMLDIGHMMITNPQITDEEEACEYILSTIDNLQDLNKYIKGIHLNKSLSGKYLQRDFSQDIKIFNTKTSFWEKIQYVKTHISNIDQHIPFDHPAIKKVIEKVNPDYLVLELLSSSLKELDDMLLAQRKVL